MAKDKGKGDKPTHRGGKKVMDEADAWDAAVRGTRRKTTTIYQKVKAVLKATRGNAEEAMQKLGIKDIRTLKRWTDSDAKKRGEPNPANLKKLNEVYNSPEVRRATIPKKRVERLKKNGMKVTIKGNQGPGSGGATYMRIREIALELPPDATDRVMEAFIEGGPESAKEQLLHEMKEGDNAYLPGAQWNYDELTKFDFKDAPEKDGDDFDE
jgi:hypothetical protein